MGPPAARPLDRAGALTMDRERFLERVTAGLRRDAARDDAAVPSLAPPALRGPSERDGMLQRFTDRLLELGGAVTPAPTRAAALAAIAQTLRDRDEAIIACPPVLTWEGVEDLWTDDVRRAGFGLSEADWGIAETGTLVLCHHGQHARGYSLVPPAVGFLLPVSRLVPRLGSVLAAVHENSARPPACITFITGPSHSADIAGVPCTGVHGPGDVHVWLISDE